MRQPRKLPWVAEVLALWTALAIGCSPVPDASPTPESPLANSVWVLAELGGDPIALHPSVQLPHLRFRERGILTGFTGCNILTGRYTGGATRLEFGDPLGTTKRMCPDSPTMVQERALLDALRDVNRYEFAGGWLNLYADDRLLGRLVAPGGTQ